MWETMALGGLGPMSQWKVWNNALSMMPGSHLYRQHYNSLPDWVKHMSCKSRQAWEAAAAQHKVN